MPGDVVTEVGTVAVRDGNDVIDKRVHDEVKRIVGLDFNQFCRTTMLAQGQFSKFYKSSDADKGVILEKYWETTCTHVSANVFTKNTRI